MQLDAGDGAAVRAQAEPDATRRELLTDPEANIRIGTAYLADKIKQFGELHLALASYNAGERPRAPLDGRAPGPAAATSSSTTSRIPRRRTT